MIVGLGNPGDEYNFTRHNFGFLALDFYAKLHDLSWQKPKHGAIWLKTDDRLFIKPQDFYNDSGISVQKFAHFYKIPPEDILVICDDFNLPFGKLRYRAHGRDGGNNGLKSLTKHLQTNCFPRLRIGSDNPSVHEQLGDVEFVLGHFTAQEKSALPEILRSVCQAIDEHSA